MMMSVCWRVGASGCGAGAGSLGAHVVQKRGIAKLCDAHLRGVAPAVAAATSLPARDHVRGFSSDEKGHRRRLWRWGGSGGMMSQQDVSEVSKEPTLLEEFQGISAAACGSSHSAFVINGQLYTYGSNKYTQLGREVEGGENKEVGAQPGLVTFETEDGTTPVVEQVALGGFHSAAITSGGALWTWGWGGSFWSGCGALGQGHRDALPKPTLVRSLANEGEQVSQVACGSQHTIILTNEGRLYSTGNGGYGVLGRGETRDEINFEEIEYFYEANDSVLHPGEPIDIVKVGAGNNFSAAMSSGGELWVWGRNDHGQLGLGEEAMGDMYSAERYPRLVRSLAMEGHIVIDFACGEHHIVVLTASGALYEWGGRTWLEPHPVTLPSRYEESLKNIVKIEAGDKCSFALTGDGQLYSWGSKSSGCLAQGADAPKNVVEPTAIPTETFKHQKVVDIVVSKSRCLAMTHEDEFVA